MNAPIANTVPLRAVPAPSAKYLDYLRRDRAKKRNIRLTQALLLIVFLCAWEILPRMHILNPLLTSYPSALWPTFLDLWTNGQLAKHIMTTLSATLVGFTLSMVIGIVVAAALWWSDFLYKVLDYRRTTEQLQVQTRCGDDDVGLELLTGGELDARLGEPLDGVGDDVGLAVANRPEQIAVGRQAQPLVPRVVARPEVLLYVVALGQPALRHGHQLLAHEVREAPADLILRGLEQDALPAVQYIRRLLRQRLLRPNRERIHVGQRTDIGR